MGCLGSPQGGGQNVPNARGGGFGGTRPESCPSKTWTFDPKIDDFYRISVERGQFQGPLEIQKFPPPVIFGDLTPLSRSPKGRGSGAKSCKVGEIGENRGKYGARVLCGIYHFAVVGLAVP